MEENIFLCLLVSIKLLGHFFFCEMMSDYLLVKASSKLHSLDESVEDWGVGIFKGVSRICQGNSNDFLN